MALNLIKRKIKIQQIPRSYNKIETIYIIWRRENEEYFLSDASLDGSLLLWHKNRLKCVGFSNSEEAQKFCEAIKKSRSFGPGTIELKTVTEKVRKSSEEDWMI